MLPRQFGQILEKILDRHECSGIAVQWNVGIILVRPILIVTEIYSKIFFVGLMKCTRKLHDMKGKTYLYIYLRTCIFIVNIYLSIHILIYLSMSVSVFLEITKLYSITVCERSVSYWRSLVLP